jgi:hypothetical protein
LEAGLLTDHFSGLNLSLTPKTNVYDDKFGLKNKKINFEINKKINFEINKKNFY